MRGVPLGWRPGDHTCTCFSLLLGCLQSLIRKGGTWRLGVRRIQAVAMHLLAKPLSGSELTFLICKMGDYPDELEQ